MTNTDPRDQPGTAGVRPAPREATLRDDERDRRPDAVSEYRDDPGAYRDGGGAYRDDAGPYRGDPGMRREPMRYEDSDGNRQDRDIPMRKVRETKPAFLTTEFWFAAGGIAALIVIYVVKDDPSLDLFRTALLASLIGIAYIISRGLAKAGSRTTRQPEDPRYAIGNSR
jgi:hypothetical protein